MKLLPREKKTVEDISVEEIMAQKFQFHQVIKSQINKPQGKEMWRKFSE